MKKGIYIDENKDVEIGRFDKPTEYVCGTKNKLTDLLSIYSEDEGSKIEINNELFSLPVLIVPKSKMNDYDIESLLAIFEDADLNDSIEISDDDFFIDDEEESDEDSEDNNSDWYWQKIIYML